MGNVNYAAIDIGSNAVRLLIKSVDSNAKDNDKRFKRLMLLRVPIRLGFDVFDRGEISSKKAEKLTRLMGVYSNLMKIYDVKEYRACATSAMRDAKNGSEIIKTIQKQSDIKIEIIGGQEEAQIIYSNHIECSDNRSGNYMFVDVGGGSTELNLLCNGKLKYSFSYNIGTVRMLSGAVKESSWKQLDSDLKQITEDMGVINIIGSGGNINRLNKIVNRRVHKQQDELAVLNLHDLYCELEPLSLEERMYQFDLKADRADVIVPAAEIFLAIAHKIRAEYIYVPQLGLSDGIIDNLYFQESKKGKKR